MKCDRRDSLVTSSETLADALEHHRIEHLGPLATGTHRQGVGCLFVAHIAPSLLYALHLQLPIP
jgi:hypothetical protein